MPAAQAGSFRGQAMPAGLQVFKRLAPGLVTPEVFERASGLLAHLDQEQQGRRYAGSPTRSGAPAGAGVGGSPPSSLMP